MIINESNSQYFRVDTTGMDKYDNILNNHDTSKNTNNLTFKIRWMHPSDYILRCARDIFNTDYDKLFDNRNDHKISKYAKMMKRGVQFNMPVINYAEHQQEGLHRAISALRLNDKDYIPVMVVYKNVPISKFKPKRSEENERKI